MSLPDANPTRKSQSSQPTNGNSVESSSGEMGKFRVQHKRDHLYVRLRYSFIRQWSRVLHPLTFMHFTWLLMWADFRESLPVPSPANGNGVYTAPPTKETNPDYGHTNGYHSLKELAEKTGVSVSAAQRSIRELHRYGLLEHAEQDPDRRIKKGKKCDWVINQDAKPPSELISLTRKGILELSARRHSDVTLVTRDQGPQSPVTRVLSHPRPGSLVTSDQGPQSPVTRGKEVLEPLETLRTPYTSSSSLAVPPAKPPTTTTTATGQDLSDLTNIGGLTLDREARQKLWSDCRQALHDVTPAEVRHCVQAKLTQWSGRTNVQNEIGLILIAVPKAVADWVPRYRSAIVANAKDLAAGAPREDPENKRLRELYEARQDLYKSPRWAGMNWEERKQAETILKQQFGFS